MERDLIPGQRKLAAWSPAASGRSGASRAARVAGYAPLLAVVALFSGLFSSEWWFFAALAGSSLPWLLFNWESTWQEAGRDQQDSQSTLEHVPNGIPAMGVRVMLLVDGFGYGEDVGVLAFVGGWLIFEGSQTSFSLAPYDMETYKRLEPVKGRDRVEMALCGLPADVRVRFTALRLDQDPGRLLASYTLVPIAADAVSVLPPLEPRPDRRGAGIFSASHSGDRIKPSIGFLLINVAAQAIALSLYAYLNDLGFSEIFVIQAVTLVALAYFGGWGLWHEANWRRAQRELHACREAFAVEEEPTAITSAVVSIHEPEPVERLATPSNFTAL